MTEYPHRIASLTVREKLPIDTLPGLSAAIRQAGEELASHGRVLVRYSGTEKKIRLLVEAREQAMVEKWIARLSEAVRAELG
jgi:phosphoglucosamine mutase